MDVTPIRRDIVARENTYQKSIDVVGSTVSRNAVIKPGCTLVYSQALVPSAASSVAVGNLPILTSFVVPAVVRPTARVDSQLPTPSPPPFPPVPSDARRATRRRALLPLRQIAADSKRVAARIAPRSLPDLLTRIRSRNGSKRPSV